MKTMKTKNMFWAVLSMTAALVMTACSNDNDMTETLAAPQAQKTIPYTVTVSDDAANTRATVKDDPTDRQLYFATGDKLYITGTNIKGVLSLQAGDEGKTTGATFSGNLTYTGEGSPADDLSLTATLVSAQQNSGQVSVDAAGAVIVNYPSTAYCFTINDAVQQYSRLTGTSTYGAKAFTLTQQTAFLNFEITFEDGTAAGETLSAVVSNGGAAVCTANVTTVTDGGVKAKFVLPVAANTTLSSATVTVGGKEAFLFGASQTLTGKVYNVKKMLTQAVTSSDLSMVDCAGNARASMWTANCYMVHTAGNYKLPLVYGNAIKDGAANTEAYNPGGTAANYFSTNFVNHNDDAITAPWITKSTDGEGVDKGMGITVTSAELLWQDAQGLITAVGISGDYLTLTVGKDAVMQEGNALVAAKDNDGNIVWSWHIWVTKQTFSNLTEIAVEVTSTTPSTSYNYQLTPVNLGWVGDATSTTGYCTFYQWGRKDAFIPGTGTDRTNHTVYDISNNEVTRFSYTQNSSMTIGGNIQNPMVFNCNSSTSAPCNTQYYNMWDAQQTGTAIAAVATVKTVYDPCPPGFCVPTVGLYSYIGGQAKPKWNTGYSYSGVFFPASNSRYYGNGTLGIAGSMGYFWSATPRDDAYCHNFYLQSYGWGLGYNYRASGFSVRAVAE